MLTALINDLTNIPDDFAVILDDYHLIKNDAIHAGITFLLEHLPPRMHLVIASRTDPSLSLSRFRGRGTLLKIGADDLRFTLDETTSLFKKLQDRDVAAEDISALNNKTEGWAVGLKMAALSLREYEDVGEFVNTFTGSQRYVGDYLIEEVLRHQPEPVKDFLLKTSILERLCAPLCDFVCERTGSQETLVNLESSNLFLFILDNSRQWFRYQHLFAELLLQQLAMAFEPEKITLLHQRASQWYEERSLPDDAIHHALAARDWQRAMRLIYAKSGNCINRGEWNTLLGWLHVIPDELLRTHQRLYCQYANVLTTIGQLEPAESVLSYLEKATQGDVRLQGEVALFQMVLVRKKGNIPLTIEMAKKALKLLPPDEFLYRARASYILGNIQMSRANLDEARSLLTDAYQAAREVADYWIWAGAAANLGWILWLRGRLREALGIYQEAVELAGHTPAAAAPN